MVQKFVGANTLRLDDSKRTMKTGNVVLDRISKQADDIRAMIQDSRESQQKDGLVNIGMQQQSSAQKSQKNMISGELHGTQSQKLAVMLAEENKNLKATQPAVY